MPRDDVTIATVSIDECSRLPRDLGERLSKTPPLDEARRVRRQIHGSTDLAEFGGSLVDLGVDAALAAKGFRVELDDRGMTMQAKIAVAQVQKIPFTLVIGDKEVESKAVAPRRYGSKEGMKPIPLEEFLALLENSTGYLIPHCRHWAMIEYPELFSRVCLDFFHDTTDYGVAS